MKLLRGAYNLNRRCVYTFINNKYYILSFERYKSDIMKYLNVAEKNDAAKNIALQLSRGTSRRREGLSKFNKIYEFDAEVFGQQAQMVMTSVSGHLLALEFAHSHKSWKACDPVSLFSADVIKYCPNDFQKIKATLEREVRSCNGLIIWTDCDREGENIGFEIIEVCTAVKKNIEIYRAKFSEITSISVRRALQNLERPNKNISDAVDVRQELDLRIGAAFTRFQTLRLQRVFPSKLADSLISYGSCQFPTLGFVVERYRAVENFISETFWKLKVNHTLNNLSVEFTWERVRLFDEEACQVLHDICLENPQAKVCEVKTKPKSKWRPLPLDTVELEKLASRKLKINAKETMRIAEKLYTQGLISYPRTETNEFPKEMNLATLVGHQIGDPNWGGFAQGILDSGGPTPRQGNKSDKAHPPIHPTKYTNGLSGNEQRVYEFVVRSFLACCSKDAQGQETTVAIDIAAEKFSANGLMITARNYLDVYPYDKWSSKEIHIYEMGQVFDPTSIDMVTGATSPPNLLTEADLITLMEKHGIGTDATHAEHIETIKSRSYVALADAIHFVPGLLGMGLVEGYDAMGLNISKPHLRAQLEADLKAISEGRKQPNVVLAEQIAKYKEVYLTATAEANKIDAALGGRFNEQPIHIPPTFETFTPTAPPAMKCPKCGCQMTVRQKKNNPEEYYIGCNAYPNCKNAVWLPGLVKSVQVLPDTCAECGSNYKKLKLEWRNNSISHLYQSPHITCLGGCDKTILEFLKIPLSNVRQTTATLQNDQTQINNRPRVNSNSSNTTASQGTRVNQVPVTLNQVLDNRNRGQTTNQARGNQANARIQSGTPSADQQSNVNQQRALPPHNSHRTPSIGDSTDNNNVYCMCNQPAILLTVRKQTPNYGKKFYKCHIDKNSGGCDFFLWAPECGEAAQGEVSHMGEAADSGERGNRGEAPLATDAQPQCNCGLPCKTFTVHKEGPNKGRMFYKCPKEYNAKCSFFSWADEENNPGFGDGSGPPQYGGAQGVRGAGGARNGGRGASRPPTTRKCGHCHQPGHTRNRCPQLND